MRTVLAMAVKDLRLMSRDWLGLFFIVGFPILMAVFFGSMYGSFDAESVSLRVAVVDEDQSTISQRFVDNLTETGNVEVEQLGREEALDRVRRGQLVGHDRAAEGLRRNGRHPLDGKPGDRSRHRSVAQGGVRPAAKG